jgi:hypothetical protein
MVTRDCPDTARFLHWRLVETRGGGRCFAAPTTNSYKRLVPGFEAPVNLAYSAANPFGGDSYSDVLRLIRN